MRRQSPVRRRGIRVYRRPALTEADVTEQQRHRGHDSIRTLIDLARALRRRAPRTSSQRGGSPRPDRSGSTPRGTRRRAAIARDRRTCGTCSTDATFRLTDSKLERLFLPIADRAGMPVPLTRQLVNGYRVDFYLARTRPRDRNRWPAIPPHAVNAVARRSPRPGPRDRRANRDSLHSRTDPLPTGRSRRRRCVLSPPTFARLMYLGSPSPQIHQALAPPRPAALAASTSTEAAACPRAGGRRCRPRVPRDLRSGRASARTACSRAR